MNNISKEVFDKHASANEHGIMVIIESNAESAFKEYAEKVCDVLKDMPHSPPEPESKPIPYTPSQRDFFIAAALSACKYVGDGCSPSGIRQTIGDVFSLADATVELLNTKQP